VSYETDPPEFTGTTQTTKADPIPGAKPQGGAKKAALPNGNGKPAVDPGTPKAVYVPPAKGVHPKIARLAAADRLDAADAALNAAQAEVTAARHSLRSAELVEADALEALTKAMPSPSQDEVYRAHIKRERDAKLARVAQGLSPTEPKKPTHDLSPISVAAANRPRTAPHAPNAPLRSNVVRRLV